MNREKAIRDGFSQGLTGQINYGGNPVNQYDSVTTGEAGPNEKQYIVYTTQSAQFLQHDERHRWQCVLDMEIVSKQLGSVSKDIVDDISEQVEAVILHGSGIVQQDGWDIQGVFLDQVQNTEFELSNNFYEISKILTFQMIITKLS